MSYKEVFKSNESSQHQLFIGTSRKSFVCVCVCGYLCYCRRFAVQISDFLNLLLAVGLLTPTNLHFSINKGFIFFADAE